MHCFIFKQQPKSYNGWKDSSKSKKANYKSTIEKAFRQFYSAHTTLLKDDLYGVLYYFYKKDLKSDADNLSKPLWDCLTGFLFEDDRQVKYRIAGSFDMTKYDFNILDLTGIPESVVIELLDAFDTEDHIVFVECGILNLSMFKFNLEENGN